MKTTPVAVVLVSLILFGGVPARGAPPILDVLQAQNLAPDVCAAFEFEGSYDPTYAAPDFPLQPDTRWGEPTETVLPGAPAFVEGHSGQGLLVEDGTTNLLTASTSGEAENLADFLPLHGAKLALDTDQPLTGDKSLKVTAPGKVSGEGFYLALSGTTGQALAGSLSLRGSGVLCVRLFDMQNYLPGAPVYVTLTPEWRRYTVPALQLETADSADVRLLVTTAGAAPATFWADALQVEPRSYATSWIPGGMTRQDRQILYPFTTDAWKLKEGTIFMWARLNWDQGTTLAKSREFLTTTPGEPGLYWSYYNRLHSIGVGGYPAANGGNPFAGGWHFFATTWSPTGTALLHNEVYATGEKGAELAKATAFRLGPNCNAVLDQWVILKRALTKAELQAIYTATR